VKTGRQFSSKTALFNVCSYIIFSTYCC